MMLLFARDQAAAALLDVSHRAKPIVFDIEHPFRVIKWVFAPGRCDWLDARKCHGTQHMVPTI
jgi:hypothetical protein